MSLVFCNIDLIIFVNWRIDLIILALCNFVLIYFGPSKYWFDNFGLLQHWFVINTLVLGSVDEGIGGLLLKSRSPMSSWHFTWPWSAGRYLIEISVSFNFALVVSLLENNTCFVNGKMAMNHQNSLRVWLKYKLSHFFACHKYYIPIRFYTTRPKPARQGLDWDRRARIQFGQVHFGVFSTSRSETLALWWVPELEFVTPVTRGGSVKILPAV